MSSWVLVTTEMTPLDPSRVRHDDRVLSGRNLGEDEERW
jgi:hypothetical protein